MARRLSGVKELIWNSCLIILPSHRSDSCKVYNGRGRIDNPHAVFVLIIYFLLYLAKICINICSL